ncbi:MAG TPA: hypothetical protein VGM18_02875 [Candidatus Sulfotelmatobacter sp.]|jgi:hypothetical protein
MRKYTSALCLVTAIVFASHLSFGQANVNESLETAFIYVDGTNGSDSNNGSKTSPLKTIGAAASMAETNNQNNIGSRVTINPGTYRESIQLNHNHKDTSLPITFEAATEGTVIVSGGTLYTGWAKYQENQSIYTTSWLNTWGVCAQITICPFQQDIMMRQEMVAVNGQTMTQVLSLTQMVQGTFYVDESSARIYVWPATGTNMNSATVEAASSPTIFQISSKSNIVVRGLTFQYANSCRDTAAVFVMGTSTNILFDSDTFQWNNGLGLKFAYPTTYFTVENSTALHNGQTGFQDSQTKYGWWQSDTASYSNWRGAQAGYYGCNTAGYHASLTHDNTIDGLTTTYNQSFGIHWDTDNANDTASGINATSNQLTGIFVEKDEGPITISSSYMCNQNLSTSVGGLVMRNSENVSLTKSVVMNNVPAQVMVIGQSGGVEVTNWETGATTNLITQNFSNTSNAIQGNSSSQQVFSDSNLGESDWTSFQTTLKSSSNTWWNAYNSSTEFVVPTPKNNSKDDFSGWKSATLTDATSSFKAPSSTTGEACSLAPVGKDYWFTIDHNLLTVNPGKSVTYNLTLTPLNFSGTVNLTLDGISEVNGLSATLSATTIKSSGTSALTVTAGTNTAPGTYSITIIANSGSITRTITTQLTVE